MSTLEPPGGPGLPPEAPMTGAGPDAAAPEPPSLPVRFAAVIHSPGATLRGVSERPSWVGALAIYLAIVAIATLVYSLNVDWEGMWRTQLESSIGWQLASSLFGEDQLDTIEKTSLNEILSLGRGGMALNTTLQSVFGTVVVFHFMLILFVTLFYLMGALADLRLARVYLDALLCLLVLILSAILGAFVRGMFGGDGRAALPWQAGLSSLFFIAYLWLLHRSIERQPELRRMASVYAHSFAIPALAAVLLIVITLVKSEPLTVPGDQVVTSNLGAILGMKTGAFGALLGALDLFTLWALSVMAIGFAAASRLSLGTAAAITFLPWGFYTMARIALAAAFQ